MPKFLFYSGTAFCLFLALSSAAVALRNFDHRGAGFIAVGASWGGAPAAAAILVALIACLSAAAIFLRMATLVAARNLFAAFVSLFAVTGSVGSLVWLAMLQSRLLVLGHVNAPAMILRPLEEM